MVPRLETPPAASGDCERCATNARADSRRRSGGESAGGRRRPAADADAVRVAEPETGASGRPETSVLEGAAKGDVVREPALAREVLDRLPRELRRLGVRVLPAV